jgi:putative DNA primase/helicase
MANFRKIKETYRQNPLNVLKQLIPNGKIEGNDYVVANPRRNDRRSGSFRIDIATGRFNDFATGDRGGDIIDLAKFVYNCNAVTAVDKLSWLLSFSFLAGDKSAESEDLPTKKKKIDPNYIWSRSVKSEDHEYLRRKHIGSGNAKVNIYRGRKQLVIPLIDSIPNKELKGLQLIQEDGSKGFPLPFRGLFHVVSGGQCNPIVIAEGYATAVSIHESTGLFAIAAMSACNMKAVALKIRELFPYSDIVIAADNDNAGRQAAEEASRALGCNVQIIYPTQGKDFNDMLIKIGSDSLKFHMLDSIKRETVYDR